MLLEGKTCVITGGAQGLGYAIAQAFTSAGARVVLGDVHGAAVVAAASQLGVGNRAIGLACDVTDAEDVHALVSRAVESFGTIDVMINNAGVTRDATLRKMSLEDFDAVIAVHLRGTWLGTRAAANAMRSLGRGGAIVNMSSISGKVGIAGQTNYSAAKAGIIGLTKAAAKELGFAGIRVNALQPGIIETPMTAALPDDIRTSRLADIPLGRFGSPAEVAQAALFLASDMSSYLTGTTIEITGGRHI